MTLGRLMQYLQVKKKAEKNRAENWPYPNVNYAEFEAAIRQAEQMLQKLGAKYVEDSENRVTWIWGNGASGSEEAQQKVFQYGNGFYRVGSVYFSEKPFIVLEYADKISGPYADAEPFPFDLPEKEFEQEIRYSLGIGPYPECG